MNLRDDLNGSVDLRVETTTTVTLVLDDEEIARIIEHWVREHIEAIPADGGALRVEVDNGTHLPSALAVWTKTEREPS